MSVSIRGLHPSVPACPPTGHLLTALLPRLPGSAPPGRGHQTGAWPAGEQCIVGRVLWWQQAGGPAVVRVVGVPVWNQSHRWAGPIPEQSHRWVGPRPEQSHRWAGPSPEQSHRWVGQRREPSHKGAGPKPEQSHRGEGPSPEQVHRWVGPRTELSHKGAGPRPEQSNRGVGSRTEHSNGGRAKPRAVTQTKILSI